MEIGKAKSRNHSEARKVEPSLPHICFFDSSDFDFAPGVVGPKCQGVLADNLDLDRSVNLIPFFVIPLLEGIATKTFEVGKDRLPVLN